MHSPAACFAALGTTRSARPRDAASPRRTGFLRLALASLGPVLLAAPSAPVQAPPAAAPRCDAPARAAVIPAVAASPLPPCSGTAPSSAAAPVAETAAGTAVPILAPPRGAAHGDDPRLHWWREARFGLFIHWGLYSILEGEWNGETHHAEWIRTSARIPLEEYERLLDRFDPVRFDAGEWARLARRAGMGYVVITTKHHDGFCLFDSERTDFDVMSTPFGRDVMAEIADAFRAEGLRVGWYHSIMDWHHPDYLPRRDWEERPIGDADFDRYVDHLRGQVTELLTRYGPIGIMWFDGEWEPTWNHRYGQALYDLCRELQPEVIVNNRVDVGRGLMGNLTEESKYAGDYGTPEQEIPSTGLRGVDWETCMTMNDHWGWNKADDHWKSAQELIRLLADVASKGGNFLLNVGPRPDGTFPPEAVERLEAIGRWMDGNGESIRGTIASPLGALPFGRATARRMPDGNTRLFLHVFERPAEGRLVLRGLGNQPAFAPRLLARPRTELVARRVEDALEIDLPAALPDAADTVVVLDLIGAPIVYRAPQIRAPAAIFVDRLTVELDAGSRALEVRYTFDGSEPDLASPRYSGPLVLSGTTLVRARTFHQGRPVSPVAERRFERVLPRPAVAIDRAALAPGLAVTRFPGTFDALPDFASLTPAERWSVPALTLGERGRAEHQALVFQGYVEVPAGGVQRIALTSDDGARLWLDGELVIDNDGLHAPVTREAHAALAAGLHALRIEWFNRTGGAELDLSLAPAGVTPAPVPPERLFHAR